MTETATIDAPAAAEPSGAAPAETTTVPPATPPAPLITTPAAEPPKEPSKDAPPTDPAPEKPAEPVVYDLKAPEGSTISPAALERTVATARARGLSAEAAQELVELQHTALREQHAAAEAAFQQQATEWQKAALSDVTLGKTPEERTAAIAKGQTVINRFVAEHPEHQAALSDILVGKGFGSHPGVVGLLAWLGKAAGEGSLALPGGPTRQPRTAAEAVYGGPTFGEKPAV
jgi:hypothetical protein